MGADERAPGLSREKRHLLLFVFLERSPRRARSAGLRPVTMVKIVELDDTETVGLASAGIGLAGSELPHKRPGSKKKITPPWAASRGAARGRAAPGATAERGDDGAVLATARPATEETPAAAPAREENEDTRARQGRTLGDAVMGLRRDADAATADASRDCRHRHNHQAERDVRHRTRQRPGLRRARGMPRERGTPAKPRTVTH